MTPERWQRIQQIFDAAMELEPPRRESFLIEASAGDDRLLGEVKALLQHTSDDDSLLKEPAVECVAGAWAEAMASEPDATLAGRTLLHYRITDRIGEGGMGVVYRARDERLQRDVAIKVLPPAFMADAERKKRFVKEARAASALNHPNVVTVHDISSVDDIDFIVMEYVAGTTLDQIIAGNGMPVQRALRYGVQIAGGLAKAHAAGIVHRDVKPANVMVTEDEIVKILDFGLAKLTEVTASERPVTDVSVEGVILGTASYMSPEQVEGLPVDARSDIFSFGLVLYEMVTGLSPFKRSSRAGTLAAILHDDPPPLPDVLHSLEELVTGCLQKDPGRRWPAMADVKSRLQALERQTDGEIPVTMRRSPHAGWRSKPKMWAGIAAVALALAAGWVAWTYYQPASALPRTVPLTSYLGNESQPALSPDGRQVAFIWDGGSTKGANLYVKLVDGGDPALISTGPALAPAWSPDGGRLAFIRHENQGGVVRDAIFVVFARGGGEQRVADAYGHRHGLAWSPDGGRLAFTHQELPTGSSLIYLLSLDSGRKTPLTRAPVKDFDEWSPRFSPDGTELAFARGDDGKADIYVASLERGTERRLTIGAVATAGLDWVADGQSLVFSALSAGRAGLYSLWKVSTSGGQPQPLAVGELGAGPTLSRSGARLAYVRANFSTQIYRVPGPTGDAGNVERLIASTGRNYRPRYAPDGTQIAFMSSRSGNLEVWVCDSEGGNCRQLTFLQRAWSGMPSWSPDGRRIAFMSINRDNYDVYLVNSAGGVAEPFTSESSDEVLPSWSNDGRWIYFGSDRTGQLEIWKTPVEGGRAIQITRNGGAVSFESEDGRFLYFSKTAARGWEQGLWRIPVAGGEDTPVVAQVAWLTWTLAGPNIAYVNAEHRPRPIFEIVNPTTGVLWQHDVPESTPMPHYLSVSPDDRWILYSATEPLASDIMLVDNYR
jgi:Tol biopolymer transport system component/predicted Ser/Thr protein kinase